MSGHSKWSQIKRKKEATDKKRGKLITQFAKIIAMAARGGADPEHNAPLKLAIQRAKVFNIPSDTIDRAIERGSGAKEGEGFVEQQYEAYGPGGSAIIVQSITDNKNRTVSDLKHILSEHGGKLAQSGGVSWMFEEKGVLEFKVGEKKEEAELIAIEADALDVELEGDTLYVSTKPHALHKTQIALREAGFDVADGSIVMMAKDHMELSGDTQKQYEELIAELEENEDVNEVFTNVQGS